MNEHFESTNIDILIENLKARLLEWETDNIRALRIKAQGLAENLQGKEGSREQIMQLRDLYQKFAQEYACDDETKIGLMFGSALILRSYGEDDEFFDEINDAMQFAYGKKMLEIAESLKEIILA